MDKKFTLKIKLLGGLKVSNGKINFPFEKKRSAQVELLVVYLILNRNVDVTKSQLMDLLWPNGNSDKPEGALRNLIYRARKETNCFLDNVDCVKSKGRRYFWNLEVNCKVDYEDLLKSCAKVLKEKQPHRKYELCLDMLEKYHDEILPELNYNQWVKEINDNLSKKCIETVMDTLMILDNYNLYEEIIRLCNHQNCQKLVDMRIYEVLLLAYYKTGKTDLGLMFYRKVVDYYYSKYGIEVSQQLKGIYEMILDASLVDQIGVEELEKSLSNDEDDRNTFYCDFDVFKNIYQVNVRSARRSMKSRILALLTLVDQSKSLDENALSQEVEILKEIISNSLRKNDVFSKFNMTQYSLILASPDLDGAKIAVDRITNRYNERRKHQETVLLNDLKQIK